MSSRKRARDGLCADKGQFQSLACACRVVVCLTFPLLPFSPCCRHSGSDIAKCNGYNNRRQ